jgi:CRISPR-associated protein Cmr2
MANVWEKKLAAWLHDPAEKALVLLRDEVGHEHGSVAKLRQLLDISKSDFDKRADWFAAAADRPQWPFEPGRPRPAWANVRWAERPVLIHPLSGQEIALGNLGDEPARAWRGVSLDHFAELIVRAADGSADPELTFLAFWRFGPQSPAPAIGALWQMLPADTRVPDHSIWQHLDVVSALAGALHDEEPALLTVSIGPVQSFIEQARSTSDLWAGSHLLSCLAWEAMRPIAEELGPDAILFPSLRGVPLVDLWLIEKHPGWRQLLDPWIRKETDESPLFAAALPNKFTAVVPRSRAAALASRAREAVRAKAREWACAAAAKVFAEAGRDGAHWRGQIDRQLAGFPEFHWACADWPIDRVDDDALRQALAVFYPADRSARPGLFGEKVWEVLSTPKSIEGAAFFEPNAGIFYPAVHELADRTLAASKSCRPFDALPQRGFRCTITGEHEWLTDELAYDGVTEAAPTVLDLPARARQSIRVGQQQGTVWHALAEKRASWAREGEHLGAIATLKRLWPTLFVEFINEKLDLSVDRYVVNTHALALAPSLEQVAAKTAADNAALIRLAGHVAPESETAVLPGSLVRALHGRPELLTLARKLPVRLERLRQSQAENDQKALALLEGELAEVLGHPRETYYGVILMDSDHMGAWLAANDGQTRLPFRSTWHPQVRASVGRFEHQPELKAYFDSPRPASPARHAFISTALNQFSLHVARHVVERIGKGRLIYSGGDDALALVAVDDLLPVLLLLRAVYSGWGNADGLRRDLDLRGLEIGKGYVRLEGKVLPTMGAKASASIGAVVAHHMAPLARVLAQARAAENRAKAAGRDAFCLRVMKRGGGEVGVTAGFGLRSDGAAAMPRLSATPAGFLQRLADTLAATDFSRRAIFAACEWLQGLPPRPDGDDASWRAMTESLLAKQFERQQGLRALAHEAVAVACAQSRPPQTARYLADLLVTAEFFARQGRSQ